jgi:CelD/BcsL family acetyltransferase involved in cellulose biosynthesis
VNDRAGGAVLETPARVLQVELVDDPDRLVDLRATWESFNARLTDHEAPFFQSHAWNLHVARVRSRRSARRYRACVATIRDGERVIGIWPLSLQRSSGAWIVKSLDEPFGQFAGVVFENSADIVAGVAAVLDALRATGLADGLHLDNVIEGTPLHHALIGLGARGRPFGEAVYVDMREYKTFGEYAQGINKKTRKNLRNLLNRLLRVADAKHVVASDPTQLHKLLTSAFDVRVQWMQHNARTSPAFRDSDFRAVVDGLSQSGVDLLGFTFASTEDELSAQWGFTYLGRYYAYISGKNPQFDPYSPGRLHLGMVIEACKDRGYDVLELMAPASDYKLTWSDHTRKLQALTMPFTIKGYFLLSILGDRVIPATQRMSRLLPHAVRRRLLNLLLRNRPDTHTSSF